jgi:hypothetical protein
LLVAATALLAGKPFGKDGSICKPCLRAFISLFTSVCNLWVIFRALAMGMKDAFLFGAGERDNTFGFSALDTR